MDSLQRWVKVSPRLHRHVDRCIARGCADGETERRDAAQALVEKQHEDLLRLKGVLAISGESRRFVLHGVHSQASSQREHALDRGSGCKRAFGCFYAYPTYSALVLPAWQPICYRCSAILIC